MRRRSWSIAAFGLWTLLIWASRIRNIAADEALDSGEKAGATAMALSFVVAGGLVIVAWARHHRQLRNVVLAAGLWTTGVWTYRSAAIWLHDHEMPFKIVHTVLAIVSIALAAVAWRAANRATDAGHLAGADEAGQPSRPAPITAAQ